MRICFFRLLALFVAAASLRTVDASLRAASAASLDSCASCGVDAAAVRSDAAEAALLRGDFLEAVKRHILTRLQMRERPNITHPVSRAAMVTALRKLHAGKVREDGRVEIPNLDGHAMSNEVHEDSEIISFAERGAA